MTSPAAVFFDFNLPNSTTWFYFSWLLAMALFFKFSRLMSIRNWDVVTLFLLVPGLLFLQEARSHPGNGQKTPTLAVATLVATNGTFTLADPVMRAVSGQAWGGEPTPTTTPWLGWGYLWLLCGSAYFLL